MRSLGMGGGGQEGKGKETRMESWGGPLPFVSLADFCTYMWERLTVNRWVGCTLRKLAECEAGWPQTRAVHTVQGTKQRDWHFGEFGFLSFLRQCLGRLQTHFVAQHDLNF